MSDKNNFDEDYHKCMDQFEEKIKKSTKHMTLYANEFFRQVKEEIADEMKESLEEQNELVDAKEKNILRMIKDKTGRSKSQSVTFISLFCALICVILFAEIFYFLNFQRFFFILCVWGGGTKK